MWEISFLKQAVDDLKCLDHSQRVIVLKAIQKVSENPLPQNEGGYGKHLGNKSGTDLSGYCKIKLLKLGLRVVYKIVRENNNMKLIVISARSDDEVYITAQKRIKK